MSKEELNALWEQLVQRFEAMSTRLDSSDASIELITMLAVSFLLGFLFCYVQGKSKH
ncbi:MAG: hypothetical protein ACPGSM_13085 [Thiolinea sp.]